MLAHSKRTLLHLTVVNWGADSLDRLVLLQNTHARALRSAIAARSSARRARPSSFDDGCKAGATSPVTAASASLTEAETAARLRRR
ncbi:hypothetical protein G6F57_022244 [Rhizopus arrhizus]|nr:hypothetical protein G6F22_021794 [Rhizopus arrhizus]KAG1433317.1 hypothetical protein G6F57_022244 [Rhizopus arrhizus]KAG1479564.1 hypothetical protein G6F53_014246 [Rhizopus delemar]